MKALLSLVVAAACTPKQPPRQELPPVVPIGSGSAKAPGPTAPKATARGAYLR